MTFAPSKKTSKSRTNRRTTAWIKAAARKLANRTALQFDAEGKAIGLLHFASPVTGEYRGRRIAGFGPKGAKRATRTVRV